MTDQEEGPGNYARVDALVVRAQRGPDAEGAKMGIYEMFKPMVERAAMQLVKNKGLREDAKQVGYLGLFRAVARYKPQAGKQGTFPFYAKRYVEGSILNYVNYERRHQAMSLGDVVYEPAAEDAAGLEALEALRVETQIEVQVAGFIESLPERWKMLVRAVYYDDRSQADVARERNISEAAVSQQMHTIYIKGRLQLTVMKAKGKSN